MNKQGNMQVLSWSGGKDSTLALEELKDTYGHIRLMTSISGEFNRISMHGVRKELLVKQAESLNCGLDIAELPWPCSNEDYERIMGDITHAYRQQGVDAIYFGDLYLQDIRQYREKQMEKAGMRAEFPIWGRNTVELAHYFVERGYKAIITCVDTRQLDKNFCSRMYDEQFLNDLPEGVDPCGENGEFHSFVFDGPIFNKSIAFKKGGFTLRDEHFYYCDLEML